MQVLLGAWPAFADATTEPMQAHGRQGIRPVASLFNQCRNHPIFGGHRG